MSQVCFRGVMTGDKVVDVQGGWDRPLAHFYLTVFDAETDDPLWSTIDFPHVEHKTSTARLRLKLAEMGITAPPAFWTHVEKREANVRYDFVEEKWDRKEI